MDLKKLIREIPDYPKPGVSYKDITTLLQNPEGLRYALDQFTERYKNEKIDYIAGIESRGFIFAPVLAHALGCGLVLVRKKGKLPHKTISQCYKLEYGEDTLEVHEDAVPKKSRLVLMDDLLATGGTAGAAAQLLSKVGADIVEVAFLIELGFLDGRKKLNDFKVFSQINY